MGRLPFAETISKLTATWIGFPNCSRPLAAAALPANRHVSPATRGSFPESRVPESRILRLSDLNPANGFMIDAMRTLLRSVCVVTAVSLAAIACSGDHPSTGPEEATEVREVTILYTNDFETAYDPIPAFWRDDLERVGGVAQLATLIEQERAQARAELPARRRRHLHRHPRQADPRRAALRADDHHGLRRHVHRQPRVRVRLVGAARRHAAGALPGAGRQPLLRGHRHPIHPAVTVLERDGFRIGVVGIFGRDAATALFPPHIKGLEVRDQVAAARTAVARLRPEVDLMVLLTHQGKTAPMQTDDEADPAVRRDIEADIRLAGAVKGVDVLIGGHADAGQETPIVHPETGTLICQTYGQGTRSAGSS